jgi:cobalt-zinc-cadmium efflux system outer membrane protein
MSWLRSIHSPSRRSWRAPVYRIALPFAWMSICARPVASQVPPVPPASITLRTVLESVSELHPAIEAARARVRAARGSQTSAGAFSNPVLGVEVENASLPGRPHPPMDRETMVTAMIPLDPFYQRSARLHRAAAQLRASEADTAALGQRVALAAVHAYYRTALAQVIVEADADLVAWLDTVVVYNRNRVSEGVAAGADLLRAELERDRAGAQAAIHTAQLSSAAAALSEFLNAPDERWNGDLLRIRVELTDEPLQFPGRQPGEADAVALIPAVRAARERLGASGAAVSIERTMLVRQLGVMVGLKQSVGTTSFLGGVSLPFPLLDRNRGEIARAKGERDAAASELVAEERAAAARLAEAAAAARILTEQTAPLTRRTADGTPALLARADETRRIALGAYREGAVPLFTVLDAARAWGEARLTYFEALFAQRESVLTLLTLQGEDLLKVLPPAEKGPAR